MRTFRLYPEERHWWSFNDYATVLDVVERRQAKRIVEFGPGSSTLALIEGGATLIDCYEDAEDWFHVYQERLERRWPDIVRMHLYAWHDPVLIVPPGHEPYDLALIDGPLGTLNRPAVLRWCVDHVRADGAILMPTEEIVYGKSALRPHIEAIAAERGLSVEWMQTGPLSGGFALITRTVTAPASQPDADQTESDITAADIAGADVRAIAEASSVEPSAAAPALTRRQRRKAAKAAKQGAASPEGADQA